mgnify:CR=1 FL=1
MLRHGGGGASNHNTLQSRVAGNRNRNRNRVHMRMRQHHASVRTSEMLATSRGCADVTFFTTMVGMLP